MSSWIVLENTSPSQYLSLSPFENESKILQHLCEVTRSLFGVCKLWARNYVTRPAGSSYFFLLDSQGRSCPKCHLWGGSKERVLCMRKQIGLNRENAVLPETFYQPATKSLLQFVGYAMADITNLLQMSNPLSGWGRQGFNWTFPPTFCPPQP